MLLKLQVVLADRTHSVNALKRKEWGGGMREYQEKRAFGVNRVSIHLSIFSFSVNSLLTDNPELSQILCSPQELLLIYEVLELESVYGILKFTHRISMPCLVPNQDTCLKKEFPTAIVSHRLAECGLRIFAKPLWVPLSPS